MIYTVTLNPSIDYVVELNQLLPGSIMRNQKEDIVFGGKGINVSHMLKNLGLDSCALGFTAGFSGEALRKGVEEYGIATAFLNVPHGFTRINVKIKAQEESEINGQGPCIREEDIVALLQKLDNLQDGDVLVLSGNIGIGMPVTIYQRIMNQLADKQILMTVDTSGQALQETLAAHPFLIKPNQAELGEMFDVTIETKEDLLVYARRLQELGARNVLVSRAGNGAILLGEDGQVYESESPSGNVVNSVGAGDSMVAGFLYGYLTTHSYAEALRYGIACGSATAFSKGIATREKVEEMIRKMGENI